MLLHIHFCPDCLKHWDCKSCGYEERKKIKVCNNCISIRSKTNQNNVSTNGGVSLNEYFTPEQLEKLQIAKEQFKQDQFINQYFSFEDEITLNSFGITLTDKSIKITDKIKEECKKELEIAARVGYKLNIVDK